MADDIVPEPRENQKLKARIDELERVVKILVRCVEELDEDTEVYSLKKGVYCGVPVE